MNLDISPELVKELRDINSILRGNDWLNYEDRKEMTYRYSTDKEYYAAKFKERARILFSYTKGDPVTYEKAFYGILDVAAKNGYGYLAQDIANLKDSVLQSNHPLDNLWRSNNIATPTPTKRIPPNIAVRAKDFIKSEWIKLTVTAIIAIVIGTYFCVKLGIIH
jgi:hypothetical protein